MVKVEPIDSTQQPISDDQELAKVLAGVNQQADDAAAATVDPVMPVVPPVADDTPMVADMPPQVEPEPIVPPVMETPPVMDTPVSAPAPEPMAMPSTVAASSDLTSVKSDAINELRPLVDKLTIPAEEKFDTYLLLLRSTDDHSLIGPAHETAKLIEDEARRAQALLDIIKEIDFLSQSGQQQ